MLRLHDVATVLAAGAAMTACATNDNARSGGDDRAPMGVGLDDVSVLLPLPGSRDDANTLRFDTEGNGGPLLPHAMFESIGEFEGQPGSDAPGAVSPGSYPLWRIVAARIDPCFPDLALLDTDPASCRRQLRLVAQPLVKSTIEEVAFDDAGVHLLYDLTEDAFAEMSARWLALSAESAHDPRRPLGVHPAIRAQGLAGPVATELRAIVTAYAGTATLSQMTFMHGESTSWDFGGFRVADGVLTPIEIHGLGEDNRTAQATLSHATGVFTITPPSPVSSSLDPLRGWASDAATDDSEVVLVASPEEIRAALQVTLDIDNPATPFNAEALDCSSCHVATRARLRAASLGASLDGLAAFEAPGFSLELAVDEDVRRSPQQQRAFGYNGTTPVWNQRVVNESAAVAAHFAGRDLSAR